MVAFRLVLASGSPARRDLLKRAGFEFDVMPANLDEPTDVGFANARSYVQHVAWLKANAVAPKTPGDPDRPTVVLAADTVGWLHGRAVGKPIDEADARRILRLLAGAEHELWTGVCLWRRPPQPSPSPPGGEGGVRGPGDLQLSWQEMSRVSMQKMSEDELTEYLRTRQWQGCSGAYAILEENDPYVRVLEGSMSNVIGLPVESVTRALEWFPFR